MNKLEELSNLYLTKIKSLNYRKLEQFPDFTGELIELTAFFPDNSSMANRVWFLKNLTLTVPKCKVCGNDAKWFANNGVYKDWCGMQCAAKFQLSKTESKYENLWSTEELVEYYHKHFPGQMNYFNLIKHHSEFYNSLKIHTKYLNSSVSASNRMWHIMNGSHVPLCNECKVKHTIWDKDERQYRLFCSNKCANSNDKVKQKTKETMLEKYGVENIAFSEEHIQKRKDTCMERYGATSFMKTEAYRTKLKETCMERYGVDHPMKVPEIVSKVTGIYKPQLTFDMEYLRECNHDKKMTFSDIAKEQNTSLATICRNFERYGIERKYYNTSGEETALREFVLDLGFEILENSRKIIKPKELDIYIPELKIAIEHCGLYWHSDLYKENCYHYDKWKACQDLGIRLITIFQNEWRYKPDIVKFKLSNILGQSKIPSFSPHDCPIFNTKNITEIENFYDTCYIYEYSHHDDTSHLALYDGCDIVSLMSIKILGDGKYELIRFASIFNNFGFDVLLNDFEKNMAPSSITATVDLRWDTGDIYQNCGFAMDEQLPPDYFYTTGDQIYSKQDFEQIYQQFPNYNSELSESDNFTNMHIHKIYDCGKQKFIKTF